MRGRETTGRVVIPYNPTITPLLSALDKNAMTLPTNGAGPAPSTAEALPKPANIPNYKEEPSHEEHQYLDLIREILCDGEHRPDRYLHH